MTIQPTSRMTWGAINKRVDWKRFQMLCVSYYKQGFSLEGEELE